MNIDEFYAAQLKAQQDLAAAQAETALALKDIAAGVKALLKTWAEYNPGAAPAGKQAKKAVKPVQEKEKAPAEEPGVIPDTVHDGEGLVEDCKPMAWSEDVTQPPEEPSVIAQVEAEAAKAEEPAPVAEEVVADRSYAMDLCSEVAEKLGPQAVMAAIASLGKDKLSKLPDDKIPGLCKYLEQLLKNYREEQ